MYQRCRTGADKRCEPGRASPAPGQRGEVEKGRLNLCPLLWAAQQRQGKAYSPASCASPPLPTAKHKLHFCGEQRDSERVAAVSAHAVCLVCEGFVCQMHAGSAAAKHCSQPQPSLCFVWCRQPCWGCACQVAFRTVWLAKRNAFQTTSSPAM